jgi:hypothetical protein
LLESYAATILVVEGSQTDIVRSNGWETNPNRIAVVERLDSRVEGCAMRAARGSSNDEREDDRGHEDKSTLFCLLSAA